MKTRFRWWIVCCLFALVGDGWGAGPALQLPSHRKLTLANGLTLLLVEQHQVPLLAIHVVVRAGSVTDPTGKEGLAALTVELLQRGTQHRTAEQIASELDFVGSTLAVEAELERVSLAGEFFKQDADTALDLLSELLQKPSFPATEVEKLIQQRVDTLKQDKEDARAILPRYFYGALFGHHPYGRPPTGDERSLVSIHRDDVVAFHQRHYGPETTIIAVAGDFAAAEMARALTERFGGWVPAGRTGAIQPPEPTPWVGKKLVLVNKPDSTQTYFAIGNVGIARTHPDRIGVELVNLVFGGRFTTMLNEALRVRSGLTYGAGSRFERHRAAGPFFLWSYTQNVNTTRAIDLALAVLKQLHTDGISDSQLRSARNYLKGQFPLCLETADQLAALLAEWEFYGLDQREVTELFARIDAFTTADARRIIQRYFPADDLVFVLIGNAATIGAAVKKYASPVERREIDQPGFQ